MVGRSRVVITSRQRARSPLLLLQLRSAVGRRTAPRAFPHTSFIRPPWTHKHSNVAAAPSTLRPLLAAAAASPLPRRLEKR